MKKLLVAATALALLGGPVLAQQKPETPAQPSARPMAPGTTGAGTPTPQAPAVRGPNDVYCGDKYIGSDPDPNVRMQMLKDYTGAECH